MPSRARSIRLALDAIAVALITLHVATLAAANAGAQWDFRSYATAVRAALSGVDPYIPQHLEVFAGRLTLPFVYPPVALLLFIPLAALPVTAAATVWIVLKVSLLAGLVVLWRRWFPNGVEIIPLALLAVFGWNGAAIWDLTSGNVSLLECALLWSAFTCFVSGRRLLFASLVVLAACFKLTPAVFLLLLLVPAGPLRPDPRTFVLSLVSLFAIVLGSMAWATRAEWQPFLLHAPPALMLGETNPSSLAFLIALAPRLGVGPLTDPMVSGIWTLYALALVLISLPALRRTWELGDPRRWVMVAVFLYVLLSPRIMAYGFVLLTPAALFLAPRPFDRPLGRLVLALMLSLQGLLRAVPHHSHLVSAPFLLTFLLWLLIVSAAHRDRAVEPGPVLPATKPAPILRR